MEFKGTPGEWKQSHRQIPNNKDGMYDTQVYTDDGETIATIHWYSKPPIIENNVKTIGSYRKENAKLIAAAPELLELAMLVNRISSRKSMPTEMEMLVFQEQSQKAINKALN